MFGCEQKLPLKTPKIRNRPGTHECFVCLSLLHFVHLMSCWWCNAYQALNTIVGSLLYIENNAVYWDPPVVCNGPQVTASLYGWIMPVQIIASEYAAVCIMLHREYALVCRASMQLSAVSMHRQQSRVCSAQCTGCCPPQRLIMIHGRNGAGRNLIKIFPSTGKTRQHTLRSVALHTFVNLCQPKLSSIPNNCMFG